ncbi:unannotated protein [freshwater metagenome]|uniref:Unannotated protein n=1 Tax=freshwater metagenome TaxID=449393 RepID=A0A6J6R282_9ZZZZ
MPTDSVGFFVRIGDRNRRVPSQVLTDALFNVFVAWEPRLFFNRDGVDVRSGDFRRRSDLKFSRPLGEAGNQIPSSSFARAIDNSVE